MPDAPKSADPAGGAGAAVDRLVEVIAVLRARCPWMGALTHASLVQYLIEESYELVEALEALGGPAGAEAGTAGARTELLGELGDVLLQVVLHAQLQHEQGGFGLREVAEGLTAKMIRRNPHVFAADGSLVASGGGAGASAEEIARTWQTVKERERPDRASAFDGIPRHLPALARAASSLHRAGALGALPDPDDAAAPDGAASGAAGPHTEEELGDALFALVRGAASRGLDPERALRAAVRRFQDSVAGPAPGGAG
ncbi:MazG nucleotide pyrophosphohydrolase domain-containing protein [Arthrobacter zhaoguopingii]|uniref:MazG nucleotide pyrophosphohydrolase domain-containing protein n=1 Tax=Arthrobacter zhaoguopingii TaxID=2681491 RepID=UPI001FE8FA0B|nr:MazG nucleotide pyrophosphohydrolase domain-containing protein [Arthrobacter zhaoguopingii]